MRQHDPDDTRILRPGDPDYIQPLPPPPPSALRRVYGMLRSTILVSCVYLMFLLILVISPGNPVGVKISMTKMFLLGWPIFVAISLWADIRAWRFDHRLWLKREAPPFWKSLVYGRPQLEPEDGRKQP